MSDVKVSQLAEDLDVQVGEVIAALKDLGLDVADHGEIVDETAVDLVREYVDEKKAAAAAGKVVEMGSAISVRDLASAMDVPPAEVQKRLVEQGILATLNHQVAPDTASKLAA